MKVHAQTKCTSNDSELRKPTGERNVIRNDETSKSMLVRPLKKILLLILSAKLLILLFLSLNSIFVMDEFAQLGSAKYLGDGFFDTIWPTKAVGYSMFYKISHFLGWDAISTLLTGRVLTAAIGCVIVIMIYASARALQASKAHALLVVVSLLSFSNFIERIFRTRSEPLAVSFAVASLLVLLRDGGLVPKRIFVAGILSGLAFITTQKSIYFNVALGLALVIDAAFMRNFGLAFSRGCWLTAGWMAPVMLYCLVFGGLSPIPVALNLLLGPVEVATVAASSYSGLERFIVDTLTRNAILYALCAIGIGLELRRFGQLESNRRVALVFTLVVTACVFLHNQPWPYVFVMAIPFLALWIYPLFQWLSEKPAHLPIAVFAVASAIGMSFVRNADYMINFGNTQQLAVVRNAERLTGKEDVYFDGVGMLPNRREPSTLWLDRTYVLRTLKEGKRSELYSIFSQMPPQTLIWSYRLDAVNPVIHKLVEASYVKVAPNIRLPGRNLKIGEPAVFVIPMSGTYGLYSDRGEFLDGELLVDGKLTRPPVTLTKGKSVVELVGSHARALLAPEGKYEGAFNAAGPDLNLFSKVYD